MIPPGDSKPPDPPSSEVAGPTPEDPLGPVPTTVGRPPDVPSWRVSVDTSDLWLCERCHSANELRVSRCYGCGAPRPPIEADGPAAWAAPGLGAIHDEETPRPGRRDRLLGVVALVGLGGLAVIAAFLLARPDVIPGSSAAASPSVEAVTTDGPSPSAVPSPTSSVRPSARPSALSSPFVVADLHAVGEPIDVLGLQTWSVLQAEDWAGSEPAPPGERYLSALVKITAGADQPTKFDQVTFSVIDAAGETRRARPSGQEPLLAYGTLEPGETTTGWVTFLVADRGPFSLAYSLPIGQNGEVETTYVKLDPIPTPSPTSTARVRPSPTPSLTTSTDNFGFGSAFSSTYYGGYGAQRPNASVGHVEGSWVQPKVSCAGSARSDLAIWVGIDDNGHRYLEQVGTAAHCPVGDGAPVYFAWYEMFPSPVVPVALPVRPGDRFSAAVTKRGTTWTLAVRNQTTGDRFTIERKRNSKGLQALWVVEAPSSQASGAGLHVLPLARFGHATLTGASAVVGGVRGDIDDPRWAHYRFVMRTSGGGLKATVSDLTRGGSSFSVTWRHR